MDTKKVLKVGARVVFFPVVGFAWPSMKKTGSLMREELARTAENTRALREVAADAKERVRSAFSKHDSSPEMSFDAAMEARREGALSSRGVYFWFLGRKRAWLVSFYTFACIGLFALLQGCLGGLAPLVVGCGLSAELAWLAEFRLWQLRGRKLSSAEGGSLRDFWAAPGAWAAAFLPELRFGLSVPQRQYRRWLWLKRLGLLATVGGCLVGVDLWFSVSHARWPTGAAIATAGLVCVLLAETRLLGLRHPLGRRPLALSLLRFETGACHEDLKS